jgi:hypothetical protein
MKSAAPSCAAYSEVSAERDASMTTLDSVLAQIDADVPGAGRKAFRPRLLQGDDDVVKRRRADIGADTV